MHEYLAATPVIDHQHPSIRELAAQLAGEAGSDSVAAHCFHWVRDRIRHSIDHGDHHVTVAASDVLQHGTGLCYAKSHLLAALLRANGIPCGFVYQRLATDESGSKFCLHGLNAVWLAEYGWYRIDPRGDRSGISTEFHPPEERLAFRTELPGEKTLDGVLAEPLPIVVAALRKYQNFAELCRNLPDWPGAESLI